MGRRDVQVITGILLTFHYRADSAQSYESVRRITEDVPYGWWLRSIHHWSSHLMVLAVLVHMVRVFVTGAYRKPREFSWLIGCGLLFVVFMPVSAISVAYGATDNSASFSTVFGRRDLSDVLPGCVSW